MTINEAAKNLLGYFSPEERTIPDSVTYPGRNAAVIKAMNHALQELFGKGGVWVRGDERGHVLYGPATVTIAVTTGSKTATITGWAAWMAGCSIVIDGAVVDNQIRNSGPPQVLKYPYSGTTGTKSAVVYHDSIEVDADVYEIHEPVKFNGRKILPMPGPSSLVSSRSGDDFGFTQSEPAVSTSVTGTASSPIAYAIDAWSPDAVTPPRLRIRLYPAPGDNGFLEFPVMISPPVVADLASTNVLPIPFNKSESIFMPMAVKALRQSPFWRGIVGEDMVDAADKTARDSLAGDNPNKNPAPRFVPPF